MDTFTETCQNGSSAKIYTLRFGFSSEDDLGAMDEFVEDFPNLSHGLWKLDDNREFGGKICIVFTGEEEAFLGFLFALTYKYGALTFFTDSMDFGNDYINEKFQKRISSQINGGCAFSQYSDAEACWRISAEPEHIEDGLQYFITKDVSQFYAGFKKMMELEIEGIYPRRFELLKAEKKLDNHPENCEENMMEEVEVGELPKCEANWHFLNKK
jgi:hypothetical protein